MKLIPQVVLLLALAAGEGAEERPQKWRLCGFLDLPYGLSPMRHFASPAIRLDPSGSLHCFCSDENTVGSEIVKVDLADGEGNFFTTVNVKLYPCLRALCKQQTTTTVVDVSNITSVELLPPLCARNLILRKTDNAGIEISIERDLSERKTRNCEGPTFISLSQTLGRNVTESLVSVRWLVPLDMGSCADSLTRNGSLPATTQVAFQNYNEKEIPHHSTSSKTQHIIVRRSNNPPSFVSSYYSAQVPENSPIGTLVATAEASDVDDGVDGEITYSMVPSTNHISAEFFQIHNTSGQITTTGLIDREMMSAHSFHVTATDGSGLDATIFYSISVTDENDNYPEFTMGNSYTLTLDEDENLNEVVLVFVVADPDEGANSQLTFSLQNNTGNTFSIVSPPHSSSGTYTSSLVLVQSLDYETLNLYQLTIMAADDGDPSYTSSATVEVSIVDVVDNPPVFTSSEFTVEVPEGTPIGTIVFRLNATTLDSPDIATVSYHLQSTSPPDFRFSLDITTGAISVHNELDYEQERLYSLSVRAQTAPNLGTPITVTINIRNVNDNSPDFIRSAYSGNIMEGVPAGRRVLIVRATDDDDGEFGEIRYFMADNDSDILGNFTLNSTTGKIFTWAVLDYETRREYSFEVLARDGGNPARYDQVAVTIQVVDQNDEAPVFVSLAHNVTVVENSGAGVPVAYVVAEDPDSPMLEYHLMSTEFRSLFSVDLTSGLVTTREDLDRESAVSYTLEISASDSYHISQENARVYVTVSDVNDQTPLFPASGYRVEVSELEQLNSTIVVVEAIDNDEEGPNSQLVYWSNDIPPYFTLSPHSGVMTLAEPVDYETRGYFNFQVWARDSGSRVLSSSAVVEVTVLDENDNTPQFTSTDRSGSVYENIPPFVGVLYLTATDADSGSNAQLEYEITGDESATESFLVDSSGVVKTSRLLDREERESYNLTIEVRDMGTVPLSSTTEVHIEVKDIIDYPPRFDSISYEKEITVFTPISTPLLRVSASTKDDVAPTSILYSLSSAANRTLFRIDRSSGVISAATNIDPLAHRGRYSFRVTAQHQHFSATASVLIEILPNSKIPRLRSLTAYLSLFTSLLTPWTTLGAIGMEKPHDKPITYSLSPSDMATQRWFSVNTVTGAISVSSAARRGHYRFEIIGASELGVGKAGVEVYVHTVSNSTLDNAVVVEFESGSEIHFVSVTFENFAAALTEIVPCSRDQVEIVGVQEEPNSRLLVVIAVREIGLRSYISKEILLDRLQANKGSSRLQNVVSFGSDVCVSEPCPNLQQCSPTVHVHRVSALRVYKVLQSTEQVFISHPFSPSFTCHCPPGNDLHDLCSVETDPCNPSPCHFNAPCHRLDDDYVCECPQHTGGKNCSQVCPSSACRPCLPDSCLHGSHCLESIDRTTYSCISCPWPAGYSGRNCELTSLHISPGGYAVFPSLKSLVKTKISFQFATVSPNGVLMFSGRVSGSHDSLSVDLAQGQIRVILSLGDPDELVTMTTHSRRRLNDGKWHEVSLNLEGHLQMLTVSVSECSEETATASSPLAGARTDSCVLQGRVATRKKSLDVDTMLYIGGVEPHVSLPPFSLSLPHYDGCLSNLTMDDRIIDLANPVRQYGTSEGCPPLGQDCPVGSCLGGDCVSVWNGAVCQCEESPECSTAGLSSVSLSKGFLGLELPQGSAFTVEKFSLGFRTRQTTATVITFGNLASLQLLDGSLVLSHNSSSTFSKLTTLTLHTTVSDGLWHTVTMTPTTTEGTKFSVDSGRATATHSLPLRPTVTTLGLGSTTADYSEDRFDGCLSDFSINVQRIDLASLIANTSSSIFSNVESLRVSPGCEMGSECTNSVCPAHSACIGGWRTHTCACEEGYVPTEGGTCTDPCTPNPCLNGGKCVVGDEGGGVVCECGEVYSGERCEQSDSDECPKGLFRSPDCRPCICHQDGVTEDVCETSGRCLCNSSLHVFSPRGDLGCQSCDCHVTGSLGPQCHPLTGECPCRHGVTGRRCDSCMDGFAGMDSEGCKEAVVVRGLFTLTTVSYQPSLDRQGSPDLHQLTSHLALQLKESLEVLAIGGEEEVKINSLKNSSGMVVVNYTVSSYSPYTGGYLPDHRLHTLASALQWVVQSGWVGVYQVDTTSHVLLTDCRSCDQISRCVLTEATPLRPQTFVCDTCPDTHSLDGVICRKNINESCTGPDVDQDGVPDSCDNCPYLFNPSQHTDDCATPPGVCPEGHSSGGVLWSSVPQYSTAVSPCDPPNIGYVLRQCESGGEWGETDRRGCISLRAQQFLSDAASVRQGQVMNIHEAIYSLSDIGLYLGGGVAGGVAGGDLSAVGGYVREVLHQLVESANRHPSEDHRLLLETIATVFSRLLSPNYIPSWTPASYQLTAFSPSLLPSTLELSSTLFHLYQSRGGASRPHLVVKTMLNISAANFTGAFVYLSVENGTTSSVYFPSDVGKVSNNKSLGQMFDVVVAVYPTLPPLLPPSSSSFSVPNGTNLTVASVVMSIQVWSEGVVARSNLSTPIIITFAHSRKAHVYSKDDAKCVIWQDTGPDVGWVEEGCEVMGGNATHTTCSCRHLSTFAVLLPSSSFLAVKGEESGDDFHPGVFTYVCLSLSVFLLLLTSLALWIFRWSSGNVYSTVYKNLVLSLLLTSLAFIVGIDRTTSPVWCSVFAVCLDFLLVSSLFWLLVVGVVTARLLLHPPPKSASCLATTCLVAGLWTVPALMCVIPVGVVAMASSSFHQDFGYPHYCLVAPEMVLVLLAPMAILLLLVVVSMAVVVVLMRTQKSKKRPGSDSYTMTPGKIAASQNRTRRHLGIMTVSLSLYLVALGSGLLALYGHAFPSPTSSILEIVFAISFTSLSGFLFVVLGLNKKVRSSIVAKLEPKYQNSSLRAIADSNSLLTRLRVGGGGGGGGSSQGRAPPTGRERVGHYHRQQRVGARIEARNHATTHEQGATSVDLFSMQAHPRTPNVTEPLYSQIGQPPPSSGAHPDSRPRGGTTTARTPPTSTPGPISGAQRHSAHRTSGAGQHRSVLRPPRVAAPPISSSGADADVDTDSEVVVGRGRRAWYHVSASEFHEHEVVQSSADVSVTTHEGTPETDDLSRADPSGVSTIGQSEAEDEGRRSGDLESGEVGRGREGGGRWSRDSAEGSLCVQTSQTGSREKRLSLGDLQPASRHHSNERETRSSSETLEAAGEEELDDIQTRLSSPQPCVDPMWYRRGSGCEETEDMPIVATDNETGQQTPLAESGIATSPQKSVTWADQEQHGNPRHSRESFTSSVSSRSIHLEPPSAASSHEGSPAPTLTPGYPGGFPGGVVSMTTPPMTSRRPVIEGGAAVVMYPHHHSTGSVPLSPTSLLSSGSSSLHSGQGSAIVIPPNRLGVSVAQRGGAVGQSPGKAINRHSPLDYHSNGPSSSSGPASQHGRSQRHIRHNRDGSKTLQSLV